MGNEKWILDNNAEWKRFWGKWNEPPPTTKAGLHPKKVILYVWWVWKRVLYYELLLENQVINHNETKKHIISHQANGRLCVPLMTRQSLLWLCWEVLIHLLYSPDTAPLDFQLFQFLQNDLNRKEFNSL